MDNNWICECDPRDAAEGFFCDGCRRAALNGKTVAEADAAHDAKTLEVQSALSAIFLADETQAHAEDELRYILRAPLTALRSNAFAARVLHGLEALGQPIGVRPTYVIKLVATEFDVARWRLKMACPRDLELDLLEHSTRLAHRLLANVQRQRGISLARHTGDRRVRFWAKVGVV